MTELKYYKQFHDKPGERKEISYDEALNTLLTTYRDNDMTRDMLTTANRIDCRFSVVDVEEITEDGMRMVLMAGLRNMLPMGTEYDEDGNRI